MAPLSSFHMCSLYPNTRRSFLDQIVAEASSVALASHSLVILAEDKIPTKCFTSLSPFSFSCLLMLTMVESWRALEHPESCRGWRLGTERGSARDCRMLRRT